MGTRTVKNPFDLWIYQEIIYDIKPDIIIEIGSLEGGTTLFFANLLDILGKGKVFSIDISRKKYHVKHNRITIFTGNSSSPKIIAKVQRLCRGKTVLIVHDGDHRKKQVMKDLLAYSNLVSIGSYFIIEDGIIDIFGDGKIFRQKEEGPLAAIEDFLSKNSNFIADSQRERYLLTYNPRGFLRRIR